MHLENLFSHYLFCFVPYVLPALKKVMCSFSCKVACVLAYLSPKRSERRLRVQTLFVGQLQSIKKELENDRPKLICYICHVYQTYFHTGFLICPQWIPSIPSTRRCSYNPSKYLPFFSLFFLFLLSLWSSSVFTASFQLHFLIKRMPSDLHY